MNAGIPENSVAARIRSSDGRNEGREKLRVVRDGLKLPAKAEVGQKTLQPRVFLHHHLQDNRAHDEIANRFRPMLLFVREHALKLGDGRIVGIGRNRAHGRSIVTFLARCLLAMSCVYSHGCSKSQNCTSTSNFPKASNTSRKRAKGAVTACQVAQRLLELANDRAEQHKLR